MDKEKLVIVGSGSAGLTAAIYAARAGLNPLVLTGIQPGGQLTITTDVENYPGFSNIIQGPWLMEEMQKQAQNVGARINFDLVEKTKFNKSPLELITDSGKIIITDSVIIATGAQAKWLGIKGEEKFNGKGVSACATCDGFFFKNRDVAVIGGGNTAVEEALYLSNICKSVILIHRREELRAEKILQQRLFAKKNVKIMWNKKVIEILGDENGVNSINLLDNITNNNSILKINGMFVAIGHDPATKAFNHSIDLDSEGYIISSENTKTSVDGVFAAGDCVDKIYRQAVTAAGMGCMAALDAEKWLSEQY
tara:strand:+ start:151 stop:1077 length:927 start_codon:yes stop_codon:yes gene_type:complete